MMPGTLRYCPDSYFRDLTATNRAKDRALVVALARDQEYGYGAATNSTSHVVYELLPFANKRGKPKEYPDRYSPSSAARARALLVAVFKELTNRYEQQVLDNLLINFRLCFKESERG
ncbi:hypothetical protein Salmi_Mp128 (mitochondrion) [Salvia miltiorrhiza]|uniref:Uncharacterized protein n=1 Tax=Salvia miltiorrhiza TaxID=226208 RepID=V9P519_SALMI|nr:hypothetical protein Salmi_Mp128 [Salvia miltiorrhiza]AGU16656.1 hypothetical protein Salmi_Mp128 [Salvia miltiorrhiza]